VKRGAAALLVLLALAAGAPAETLEELLFRARHAQFVEGDPESAIRLYQKALEDTSLDAGRQAEIHLRIGLCCEELDDARQALDHLTPHLYAGRQVAPEVRREAEAARARVEAKLPREAEPVAEGPDPAEIVKERLAEEIRSAQRCLDSGDEVSALVHVERALKLDPDNADARRIDAELERRLTGITDFIRDPLRFVRTWTDTRITQVAQAAQEHLAQAVAHAEAKEHNLAWASFREALHTIDSCELGRESDRLIVLRQRIVARWEGAYRAALGKPLPAAETDAPAARSTVLSEFLNRLQNLLDLVSSQEQEYRLVPVQAAHQPVPTGWQAKPAAYRLFRDLPSRWSPALFARSYLPLRVYPESWAERENYVEAVGGMLVVRNRPEVLDAVLAETRRLERPPRPTLEGRFLVVPLKRDAVAAFEKEFGKFEVSHRGADPVQYRVIPPRFSIEHICSQLRGLGTEVRLSADTFALELANGAPQTLFMAQPLKGAPGYADFHATGGSSLETHYGLLVDLFPYRDRLGRLAGGLRLSVRMPAPPLADGTPRFLTQEAELFADLPPGATLAVAGLLDPFSQGEDEVLLLWQNPTTADLEVPEPGPGAEASREVPLRDLLLRQRDFPGPRADAVTGFVPRDRLEALQGRADFLQRILRSELESDAVTVSVEDAVVRVPRDLRKDAEQVVAALERESSRSYVVEVATRAVRSAVLARWLAREGLTLSRMDGAEYALADAPHPSFLLKGLDPTEPADVFAPREDWSEPTVLGLQCRHLLSARSRTSPAYTAEEELASGETRTITEGLRITVRPYTWRGNRLNVEVEIETTALDADDEERALPQAVPSRRTRFSGTIARGSLDLGYPTAPRTAIICRIPHPTLSRPERLTEIVIALSVRRIE